MAKASYEKILKDCQKIKQFWAEGIDDTTVKAKLSLTSKQYNTRLKYIARDRYNENKELLLLKYEMKMQERYTQLKALMMTTKSEHVRLKCIQEMGDIDEKFIDLGQRLGVFPQATKVTRSEIEAKAMTLGVNVDMSEIPEDFKKRVISNTKQYIRDKHMVQCKRPTLADIKKQDDVIDIKPLKKKIKEKIKRKRKKRSK